MSGQPRSNPTHQMPHRRAVAVLAVIAVVLGLSIGAPPPSYAADPGVARLLGLLGTGPADPVKNLATWTEGLGGIGKLAEPLPLVQATPGGLLGFAPSGGSAGLFEQAVTSELAGATQYADLNVDKDVSIDGGRTGHLTTTLSDAGDGKRLHIVATVTKQVTKQSLHLVNATPKVDLTITEGVTVGLAVRLALDIVWTGATDDQVYVVSGADGPRLDVDAHATVDGSTAKAATGILGVTISDPTLTVDAHLLGTVSDPDNDGRLSFADALGQDGSLAGLVTVGLDPDGAAPTGAPSTRGSVSGHVTLGAASTFGSTPLPGGLTLPSDISTTVGVDWPDIGTGGPTVTAPGLADTIGKFQNLSIGDLASGLAQIVVAIDGMQKKKWEGKGDLDLPFMRGKLSDAVQVGAKLAAFLDDHSVKDPANPAVSAPTYGSLQELLKLLAETAGISVSNLSWDQATSKLALRLALTKAAPASPVDLDKASALASGPTATYGASTLSVSGTPWRDPKDGTVKSWVGRIVTAGTSVGTVASNDDHSLTLAQPWQGGTPAPGTPFVITGSEPHVGAVTFANRLTTGAPGSQRGILNANADQTFAQVAPSYTATLTVVLDLQDPRDGDPLSCVGFEGNPQECPFNQTSDGLSVHVAELPLNTDRVMLRTGNDPDGHPYTGFAADFPITSKVDLTANAGFFKVRLTGSLSVCHSSLAATCPAGGTPTGRMLTLSLKQAGDAQHDIRMSRLFRTLADSPGTLLDVQLAARAHASVDVDVVLPDGQSFLPAGATTAFTANWDDLADPGSLHLDTADLSEIFDLDFKAGSPQALFALLIRSLQTLAEQVATTDSSAGGGVLGQEIPGLGRSLRDLLAADESNSGDQVTYGSDTLVDGSRDQASEAFPASLEGRTVVVGTRVAIVKKVVDGKTLQMAAPWEGAAPAKGTAYVVRSALADAIDRLLLAPPDNLQDVVALLNDALGTDSVRFRYLPGSPASLVLDIDWARSYHVGTPVKLDLGGAGTFASVSSSAQASVEVDGRVKVGLVIPLADGAGPTDALGLKVLEKSSLALHARAEVKGTVEGMIGPLSVALGKTGDDAVAQADLSVGLAKPGASDTKAVSFSDFLSGAALTFNAASGKAECGASLATPLMVCAHLPVYFNGALVGPIELRLPKSTDPADLTNVNGNLPAPDDTLPKLQVPDLAAFAGSALDFGNFDDGIDAYLARIEQALQIASFNGKLPLVGDDLQQGSDFVGKIRKTIDDAWKQLGTTPPQTTEDFEAFINGQLKDALKGAGIGVSVKVSSDCTAVLEPTTLQSVTPDQKPLADGDADPGTGSFAYRVVAYQGDGTGYAGDTLASNEVSATNWVNLYGGSSNKLTWTKVDGAKGYKVLRKLPGATGFKLVQTVASGSTVEWTDTSAADTGSAYDLGQLQAKPKRNPCPAGAGDNFFVDLDLHQGTIDANGCTDPTTETDAVKNCLGTDSAPLDIGIPGLALRQGDAANGLKLDLGYSVHLRLGLNKTDGLFIATHDGWDGGKAKPEFQVGLDVSLPDAMQAELAFIDIDVKKLGTKPELVGLFQLDVNSGASSDKSCFAGEPATNCDPTDAKLPFAEIGTVPIEKMLPFRVSAGVAIAWQLRARADSALPGIGADFHLDWSIDNKPESQLGVPTISFQHVGIEAGTFFADLLGPVVENIKKVTTPVQPVVDTLYAPIPVLSDLSRMAGGGDVTLITLAKAYSTLANGPDLDFVDTIKAINDFITRLPTTCAADCFIDLGSFQVSGQKALDTSNSPGAASTMYEKTDAADGDVVKTALNQADPNGPDLFGVGGQGLAAADPPKGDVDKAGFKFPILDDPLQAFNVLMGGDVDLVTFDSGPLQIGFSWRQDFGPVYAPPPVVITLAGSASATLRIRAGLDTYGLRKTVEAVRAGQHPDALTFLDGLYFSTVDQNGSPVAVVTLTGSIAAGAAVTALIVKVGIEGGLRLTIGFYWNDPNDDGKFRLTEVGQAILNNPVCLFRMSGELSLFLNLVITIGIGPFSTSFSIELANIKLLDFSVTPDCKPKPPVLGKADGDTLVVYAGRLGDGGTRGDPAWDKSKFDTDTVKVIALHYAQTPANPAGDNGDFDGVAVEALGFHQEFLNSGLKRVVVDGTGSDKPLIATFIGDGEKKGEQDEANAGKKPTVFDLDAVVIGSDKKDKINTGVGNAYVDGRGDDDVVVTHEDPGKVARIAGGAGGDTISTGNGDDRVTGDGTLGTTTRTVAGHAVFDWTTDRAQDPTAYDDTPTPTGDDTIALGLGKNVARGNAGADKIGVAADQPQEPDPKAPAPLKAQPNVLIGDAGGDRITGGTNADRIFTASRDPFADATATPATGVDDAGPADDDGTVNVVDTGVGADTVWGSDQVDLVTSHSQPGQTTRIYGGGKNDVLIGGYGTDEVYGGPGDDYVIAEPAQVGDPAGDDNGFGPRRLVTHLPLPAGVTSSTKLLVGGLGNDHLIGGDGTATMFGDRRIDAEKCAPGDPVTSDPVAESTTGGPNPATDDGNDLILGGAGVDTVSAGGGDDTAKVFGNLDLVCGQQGVDTVFGGDGADRVWGGTGADVEHGEAGNDQLFGNRGADVAYGGVDDDTVEGNDGPDWVSGGAGNDTVYGGTRAAGRPDTDTAGTGGAAKGDDLYGDSGTDTLIGDNGTVDAPYPLDLGASISGAVSDPGAGDRLHGGADADMAYGGLGDDVVNGNDADDYLEGNNGADTVHGNANDDRIIGGSSQQASAGVGRPDTGDALFGDGGADLVTGDNAILTIAATTADATRVTLGRGFLPLHRVTLLDLGSTPTAGTSGGDRIEGGDGQDVVYAQGGADRAKGNDQDDYVEGGPGVDWIEGDGGADDLVGGSSTPSAGSGDATSGQPDTSDAIAGGPGDDVVLGDDGQVLRLLAGDSPTKATVRLGSAPGVAMTPRIAQPYDVRNGGSLLTAPTAERFGADQVSGGSGVDVLFGQDGGDYVSGGPDGDYVEGNGGADVLRGDLALGTAGHAVVPSLPDPGWPGQASDPAQLTGSGADGQDDLIGGTSTRGFRDAGDQVEGDGGDDVELGDNGTLLRTLQGDPGSRTERVYTDRYPNGAVPPDATRSRVHDPDAGDVSTRFCSTAQATCEVTGAYGADTLWGDAGDDGQWGQDGGDTLWGGGDDDDMFGELGDDTLFGETGRDAMLGDRGGVVDEYLDTGDDPATVTITLNQVPQETFVGFRRGSYDRRVDLLHDADGDQWVGGSTSAAMPHNGIAEGGRDRLRGGPDADNVHAGFGDDLANGDSGGDVVFGDDGEDVLWGGRGCDPVLDAAAPDCRTGGAFDPTARGTNDRFVDHVFGGVGEVAGQTVNVSGSDILDWRPRGTYVPGTGCATGDWPVEAGTKKSPTTIDPCVWFQMTNMDNADSADNQHHQGTDWIYGGWDRDVLQGDVAANGPNPGDRLIDWTGAYNLYTHCNASYGGYNDIRLLAPAVLDFLNSLAWADGAGRSASDVLTGGTSAYRELALTYNPDFQDHGNGQAYPSTPGHFDSPNACGD